MRRGGGKGGAGSAYELLAPTVAPGPVARAVSTGQRAASRDQGPSADLPPPGHDRRPGTPAPQQAGGNANGYDRGRRNGSGTGLLEREGPVPDAFTTPTADPVPVLPTPSAPRTARVHPPVTTRPPDVRPVPPPPAVRPVGATPTVRSTVRKHRRFAVAKVAVVTATLALVAFQIAVLRPWLSARLDPPTAPQHGGTSLPFTSASTTVQPPANPDPSAPGQPVDSGENRSDPFLYLADGRYYLYTSGEPFTNRLNVPVSTSTDFRHWSPVTNALPALPPWATAGFTWSPDVHQFGSTYVLYFTAHIDALQEECIGDATSSSPAGPFVSNEVQPLICQTALRGSIDPRVFTDSSGINWMVWKSDQNNRSTTAPVTLWSQQLTPDGLGLIGTPNDLMSPDEPWQGTILEAPDMFEVNGVYWLAYSGNWFNQPPYAIGVAWCLKPEGPCVDVTDHPVLGTNAQGQGPGEESIYQDATGGVWMLYTPVMSSQFDPPRPVYVTRIGLTNHGAYLAAGGPPAPVSPLTPSAGSDP
jgi:GH43 family beta-xylosidase